MPAWVLVWAVLALGAAGAGAGEGELPWIARILAPPYLRAGQPAELRVSYRAPGANVVAVVEALEDLDGPPLGRVMREREVGVVARAFGYTRGELVLSLAFATPGRKRVTLTLVTDERDLSDPAVIELAVLP